MKSDVHYHHSIKKIRACPYFSPFKGICVNCRHPYVGLYRHPRCDFRGKFANCDIIDKIIELTLDDNDRVINKEYIYLKDLEKMKELKKN